MLPNYRKVDTRSFDAYAAKVQEDIRKERANGQITNISFPCHRPLTEGLSFRQLFNLVRETTEKPQTYRCGNELDGKVSVICKTCFTEYDHQTFGDVESLPLRGSKS